MLVYEVMVVVPDSAEGVNLRSRFGPSLRGRYASTRAWFWITNALSNCSDDAEAHLGGLRRLRARCVFASCSRQQFRDA